MTFRVAEILHEGRFSQVLRCVRQPENDRVVLKRIPTAGLTPSHIARLRYEYRILTQLAAANVPHVVRCLGWGDYDGAPAMVLEDLGGRAVSTYSPGLAWDPAEALHIGIGTARALQGLHRAGIVHKDINPSNIVYARAQQSLQLIDLGISSELPREVQVTDNVRSLEGTLAYMPPEQTGRLARSVDWRADLYSLGATLYELLSGHVPFEGDDTAALIYAVVAKQPPPLQDVAKVPSEVAQLVHRLLAKAPEDRYQSAHGVLHDLQACAERLQDVHARPLVLGTADRTERFALSEKLYGRAGDLAALETQYSRANLGGCALALVRGPSGIGKSALVQELQPTLARDAALFGLGKCDLLHRNVPFHVMRQALSVLVKRLLMEPAAALEASSRRVQAAVGNAGQALVAQVPGLEALIGPQKPVPALPPQETENRLLMLFVSVFQALARRHPLVLFFDDLQWADAGTFKLLTQLCTSEPQGEKLLLVLAYRDNEVGTDHPLQIMLRDLLERGVRPEALTMAPLSVDDVAQMIGDATASAESTRPLAELVHSKTHGNAFFVRDMLQRLWAQGLLSVDAHSGQWTWDAQAIATSAVSAAVADGMLARWQGLPAATQEALSAAACVGQDFSLEQVCKALQQPAATTQRALGEAMREGLLIPLSGDYRYESSDALTSSVRYRFAHDKVQHTAAQHALPSARADWHHRLGNALSEARAAGDPVDLFALVGHWNLAQAQVTAAGQKLEAAEANLQAGQQALLMGAPAKADECLRVGLAHLPADAWTRHEVLCRELECSLAEAEFLSGHTLEAIARLDGALAHERSPLERMRTLRRRSLLYSSHNLFAESMRDTFAALRLLNYPAVEDATQFHVIREFIRLKIVLRGKDIVALGETPFSQDPQWAETLLVTSTLGISALALKPLVLAVICLQVVRMVIQRGLVPATPLTFASMFPICAMMGDYPQAHQWRQALRRCMERSPESSAHGMANFLCLAYIDHTVLRPAVYLEYAQEVSRTLLEEGQPVQATWPLMPMRLVAMITSLDACNEALARCDALIHDHGAPDQKDMQNLVREFSAWSQERAPTFVPDVEALRARLQGYTRANHTMFWSVVGTARWLDEDYDAALSVWRDTFYPQVFETIDSVLAHVAFFAALSCTAHARAHGRARPSELALFKKARGKLQALARGAPSLFGGCAPLIAAELSALRNRHEEAALLYEDATRQLAGSGWVGFAVAASECAARHARACGRHAAAAAHLMRALAQCRQWGNRRKARLLEQAFSEYYEPSSPEADFFAGQRSAGHITRNKSAQGHTDSGHDHAIDFPRLLAVSHALAEERDVRAVAAKILDFTVQNAAANRGVLLLDFKDGKGMQPFADTAQDAQPLPTQLISLAARTLEPQLLNDVSRAAERDENLRHGRVKAVLVAPLAHQGECIGVLVLENHVITGAFTPERLTLLHVFAAQAAVAVENARSRDDLERLVSDRTGQLQAAHARILRYERDAAEVQMAGGFAHEMRNALASAGYTADVLFGKSPGSLHLQALEDLEQLERHSSGAQPASVRTALEASIATLRESEAAREQMGEAVVSAVKRGHALTEQILRYAEAGTLRPGDDTVCAKDVVSRVLSDLRQSAASLPPDTLVDIPAQLVLPMKEEHAYIVLRNLLKNAVEALHDPQLPQPKRIAIRGEVTPRNTLLAVEDTGVGISAEAQKRIFQPFFSTKGAAGTGLGLGLSRKLAQVYGGDLRFSSEPAQGTRFELVLPPPSRR